MVIMRVTTYMNKLGFITLTIGGIFLLIQNIFYGYLDSEGVLHDSLFLPLGSITMILGLSILLLSGITHCVRKVLH